MQNDCVTDVGADDEPSPEGASLPNLKGTTDPSPAAWTDDAEDVGVHNSIREVQSGNSCSRRLSRKVGKYIAKFPFVVAGSCCAIILVLSVSVVLSGAAAFSETSNRDWEVLNHYLVEHGHAIERAQNYVDGASGADSENATAEESTERRNGDSHTLGVTFMYRSRSGTIFSPTKFQSLCKVERLFFGLSAYPEVCHLIPGRAEAVQAAKEAGDASASFAFEDCDAQTASVVFRAYAIAGMDIRECGLLPEASLQVLSDELHMGLTNPETFRVSGFYLGNDIFENGNWTGARTSKTRSILELGYPLPELEGKDLWSPDALGVYEERFFNDFETAFLGNFGLEHSSMRSAYWDTFVTDEDIEVLMYSTVVFNMETNRIIDSDMLFCLFSIVFVGGYLTFHTQSFFVAMISLWQIVMTIPACLFIYRFIFGITYYQQLHGLLIFIILGVGADDVFVFSDAWRQSEHIVSCAEKTRPEQDRLDNPWDKMKILSERVAFAYRHTLITVMNTSLTTGVAFLSTATSPIMPIRSMGIYAFTLVTANYICAITMTPAVFVIRERYLCNVRLPPCCCRRCPQIHSQTEIEPHAINVKAPPPAAEAAAEAAAQDSPTVTEPGSEGANATAAAKGDDDGAGDNAGGTVSGLGCSSPKEERASGRSPSLTLKIPGLMKFGPSTSSIARRNTMQRVNNSLLQLQQEHAPVLIGRVIIPIMSNPYISFLCFIVLSSWAIINFICATKLEAPEEAFTFFADEHMRSRSIDFAGKEFAAGADSDYNTLVVSFGVSGIDREKAPGIDQWKPHEWIGWPVYDAGFDLAPAASQRFLRNFCRSLREAPCSAEGCNPIGFLVQRTEGSVRCFIEAFDEWNNGELYEGQEFLDRLKLFRQEVGGWGELIGFVEGELRFVQVRGQMSLLSNQGSYTKEGVLDRLEDFLDQEKNKAPLAMKTIIQTVPSDWSWFITSESLISGLFTGFAICFPVAFLILLLATRNIVIATWAIVNVAFIVSDVLGYCYFAGWSLGAGECVAGIIVIGLAVDYVIHLGHMYLEASHLGIESRQERWSFALNTIGSTVIAGAATTFFAGLVMQFCQIVFFNQMSTLMVLTIVYSIVYAIFCFMAFLRFAGPEGRCGDISHLFKWERTFRV